MPIVSIALIKQSNNMLAAKKVVATRSSKLSKANLNDLMKQAYSRLSR